MTIKLNKKQKIKVLNGEDVFSIMQEVLMRESKINRNKEHLWTIALSQNNNILLIELVTLGMNAVHVEPVDIFSFMLQKRAVKMILVHNHPSGELEPSTGDIEMTDVMQSIGTFLQLPLADHLIISERGFFSFMESGLLGKIVRESTYDLSFAKTNKLLEEIKTQGSIIEQLKDKLEKMQKDNSRKNKR
ncbi:MAG: JAB domain-containing protein [Chitinophagaceae bacterium]